MKRLLREPLVHFLIAGFAIFLFFSWRGEDPDPASRRIVVSEDQVGRLTTLWTATWQRPPSPDEIDGLIREHIKDEIYYREALRMGLDSDDTIVRRRMRAKVEALAAAEAEPGEPDEAVLRKWFAANAEKYGGTARIAFAQVYAGSEADAKALLAAGGDPAGKPISLPPTLDAASTEIDRQFGEGFAAALLQLPQGRWAGPVQSGFGYHLVRVAKVELQTPRFDDVRARVSTDWRSETRRVREARGYQALLDGYDIRIERPR